MRLTASLLIYNSPLDGLRRAAGCLLQSGVERIWIIYNGGRNEVLDTLLNEFKGAEFSVIAAENNGYGAGHNIALRQVLNSNVDYHLVLNSDVHWSGDVLTPMLKAMDADRQIGLMAPRTLNLDGSLQATARMLPTPLDLFLKRATPSGWFKARKQRYLLDRLLSANCLVNSPFLLGSFMLFRVEALRSEGLFDERFFMYHEDIDITRRIHQNWLTLYWPHVTVIHAHRRESARSLRMFIIHLANMARYFNKWGWFFDRERRRINSALKS